MVSGRLRSDVVSVWTFTVEENPGGGQSLALIDDSGL